MSLLLFAQYTPTPLDDLAYVIPQPAGKVQVEEALYTFTENSGIPFRITTLFEADDLSESVLQRHQQWLASHTRAVSLLVWVEGPAQQYSRCKLEVTQALLSVLTTAERQKVVAEVMEPLFKSTAVANDAYSRGLTAGIQAIQQALQQNDYSLEMLVKEILLLLQQENIREADSLRKGLEARRERYYSLIDNHGWLRWMYAGKDGLFIREGISEDEKINRKAEPFLGLSLQPEDRKKYEKEKLQLFDQWLEIYHTDSLLLRTGSKGRLLQDFLEEKQLRVLTDHLQSGTDSIDLASPKGFKLIQTLVSEYVDNRLENEVHGRKG